MMFCRFTDSVRCRVLRSLTIIALMLVLSARIAGTVEGQSESGDRFSIDLADFKSLPDSDRAVLLLEAFQRRIEHSRNLSYECSLILRNHKWADGKVGDIVWRGLKFRYHHWSLNESYAVETRPFGDPENEEPKTISKTSYDAASGISRSATSLDPNKPKVAAITSQKNQITETNRYSYWLDGTPNGYAQFLFRDLVEARDHYSIVVNDAEGLVELTIPWKPRGFPEVEGTWKYSLNPRQGFLPVRGEGQWRGRGHWREETFQVRDARLVDDVWMPLDLHETVRASSGAPDTVNVYETRVLSIEHGQVTPQDLEVEFGERAYVADKTRGVKYFTDPAGKPVDSTVKPLFQPAPPPRPSTSLTTLVLLGANGLAVVLYTVVRILASRRRARNARLSDQAPA